ncbi:MAG TPA: hypothetical protein VJ739_15445 [Gemmataceae bacterium]|nr:hypothetical protein [Gemmataceae bacterium]
MSRKLPWHKPMVHHLDARATAQDADAAHFDPNNNGDLSSLENSETHTAFGAQHAQFDSH